MVNPSHAGLSLARGFIVLVMPAVHTVLLYSAPEVKVGPLGSVLRVFAEGPGAPLFMFLMGVLIVLGRPKSLYQIGKRSLLLLTSGYMLNLFRLVIPFLLGWIPAAYLTDNNIAFDGSTAIQLFLVGDILQFASIAYFVCSIVHLLKVDIKGIIAILLLLLFITPYTWELSFKNQYVDHSFHLFNGQPPQAFFPVFPWLFYPLLGLLVGKIYQWHSYKRILRLHVVLGSVLILTGLLISLTEPVSWNTNFYRVGRGATLWHSGLVLIWVALFLFLSKLIKRSWIFSLLEYLSRHITFIYVAQWVIILWLFPLFGYNELDLIPTLLALILTSVLSFSLLWLMKRVRQQII
jgi:surface polysaccharide O-acyltransferase-like enzyme